MDETELEPKAPGELVPYGNRSYYKPDPLPPSRPLDLEDSFYGRLADATYWLGKLSGISLEFDFPLVLYTSLLRKEAMESAEIEGADVDFNALYSHETLATGASADRSETHTHRSRTRRTSAMYSITNRQSRMVSRRSMQERRSLSTCCMNSTKRC